MNLKRDDEFGEEYVRRIEIDTSTLALEQAMKQLSLLGAKRFRSIPDGSLR
jgi:hypothetical protein